MTTPEWAQRVLALRKKLGLKQVDFATHFGVTQPAVSRWENGSKEPSVENYVRMGNLAGAPDCYWFWERVGLDLNQIRCNKKER